MDSFTPNWLQPSYYQNISHQQVDWAQLAQQWIAMKDAQDHSAASAGPPLSEAQQASAFSSDHQIPVASDSEWYSDTGQSNSWTTSQLPGSYYQPQPNAEQSTLHNWLPTSQDAVSVYGEPFSSDNAGADGSGGHDATTASADARSNVAHPEMYGDWGGASGSYTDPYGRPPQHHHGYYPEKYDAGGSATNWQQPSSYAPDPSGSGQPLFIPHHDVDYRHLIHSGVPPHASMHHHSGDVSAVLDRQQRKNLPAWIREGLEKMEKDKLKQRAKEEKSAREQEEAERKAKERERKTQADGVVRSKFDSDSESESRDEPPASDPANDHRGESSSAASSHDESADQRVGSVSPQRREIEKKHTVAASGARESSPVMSVEERRAEVLRLLRIWLTEILMDVTTAEIAKLADAVYRRERDKGDESDTGAGDSDEDGSDSEVEDVRSRKSTGSAKAKRSRSHSNEMEHSVKPEDKGDKNQGKGSNSFKSEEKPARSSGDLANSQNSSTIHHDPRNLHKELEHDPRERAARHHVSSTDVMEEERLPKSYSSKRVRSSSSSSSGSVSDQDISPRSRKQSKHVSPRRVEKESRHASRVEKARKRRRSSSYDSPPRKHSNKRLISKSTTNKASDYGTTDKKSPSERNGRSRHSAKRHKRSKKSKAHVSYYRSRSRSPSPRKVHRRVERTYDYESSSSTE